MRRAMRWLGLVVLALALLLGAALAWANSAAGLRGLARLAQGAAPGLRLEGLQGPLPWRLGFASLSQADAEGEWLRLEQGEVRLDPVGLLRGTLRFTTLRAGLLRLHRLPANQPAPASDQMLPQPPHLPLGLELAELGIGRLELGAPVLGQAAVFNLQGQASLHRRALAATLALARLDAPGRVALRLATTPTSIEANLEAEDAPGGPLAALAGQPGQPLALALHLAGPASGARLSLQARQGEALRLEASGLAGSQADGSLTLRLDGTAHFAPLLAPEVAALASPARFALDATLGADRLLLLRQAKLAAAGGEASATGSLHLATEALGLRLAATLPASPAFAAWLPPGLAWQGLAAQAQVSGTLARPRLAAEASASGASTGQPALDAALGPTPALHATLAWPERLVQLRLQGAAAELNLAGSAAEPLDLRASLALPRLAALGPGFAGSASLQATAQGPWQNPDLALEAQSGQLVLRGETLEGFALSARLRQPRSRPEAEVTAQGRYAGQPLSLALRARPEGQQVVLHAAEAGFGNARLHAEGSLDLASWLFSGAARLEVPELAPLARLAGQPGLAGRLAGSATLQPQAGAQGFALRLEALALALAGQAGTLRGEATGVPADFGFALNGASGAARLALQGRAGVAAAGWSLTLARLEAQGFNETLRLLAPARLVGRPDGGVELAGLNLALGRGGQVEAAGRWGPAQADMTLRLKALPLALAQPALPGVALQGSLDAELRATGPLASPNLALRLNGSGLRAGLPGLAGLPATTLHATGQRTGEAYALQAEAQAGAAGQLRATLQLPAGLGGALQASLDGTLNLAPLAAPLLAAGGERVAGRVALALGASGTLAAPRLAGRAGLAGGSYRNLPLGIRLNEMGGTLLAEGETLRLEGFTARTEGGGRLGLAGWVQPLAPGLPVQLDLTARNARPLTADLLSATLDADIRLAGPLAGGARASGRIAMARAEVRLPERLPASIASLGEVRERGPRPPGRGPLAAPRAPASPAPAVALALEVAVRRAFIRGRGLDAELAGTLALAGTSQAPEVTGSLDLARGSLSILARRLTFQRGNLAFASGTLMPQLDFAASTTASNTTLTAQVAGTPLAPLLSFSSSPDLPQDEILARLIFDRPTSRLSPFEIAQLASAAAELSGAASTSGLLDRLRGGLGLDRLGVVSDPTKANGAAVEAGRYVAPGLYLGVRQGSNGTTGVGVQLELTDRLKLEGQTATGPAGDRAGLSYELEY